MVGILILVHQDIAETVLILGQHVGKARQKLIGAQQQVVEIHCPRLETPLYILAVHVEELRPARRRVRFGAFRITVVGIDGDQVVLQRGDTPLDLFGFVDLLVQLHILDDLSDQPKAVVRIVNGKIGRKAQAVRLGAQNPRKDRMERPHPQRLRIGISYHGRDTRLHLARRLVGKGQRQDLKR